MLHSYFASLTVRLSEPGDLRKVKPEAGTAARAIHGRSLPEKNLRRQNLATSTNPLQFIITDY